jgi:hypothetical protein
MRTPIGLVVAALLALGSPARAGDLTGLWKGKFACTLMSEAGKEKLSSRTVTAPEAGVSTLEVTHPDGPGTTTLQLRIDNGLRAGFLLGSAEAEKGAGAIIDCSAAIDPTGFGEIRNFRFKAKAGEVKATLSWRGLLVEDGMVVGSCKGRWKRVSLQDPLIPRCR